MVVVRDNFSKSVRSAVALRAGYICSFPDCLRLTVGPSDEAPDASACIGEAAHISAASSGPGARRYDPTMTAEERRSIANAIWLCANHATYIDRDEVAYTTEVIKGWKREHEARIKLAVARDGTPLVGFGRGFDLISLGPDIIATGHLQGTQAARWRLHLEHFVAGDVTSLISFGESFEARATSDPHLLLESLGDGRVISAAPSWTREGGGIDLVVDVLPRFKRIAAADLGSDLRLVEGDITPTLELISGAARVPQLVETVLGMRQGESAFAPAFGNRLSEYYALFGGTPWLERLVKLEIARMAAIPTFDPMLGTDYTQLQCVERVLSVEVLSEQLANRRLPIRVALDVAGLGTWEHDINVYLSKYPPPPPPVPPSVTDLGP